MNENSNESNVLDCMCELSKRIIDGATLDEALEQIFATFVTVIPYDRIGYAEVDLDEQVVTACWMRSHLPALLKGGYSAPLSESSLAMVIERRAPRIMNDLPSYLDRKPQSHSTRLIVQEGIKSSLTCPLFVNGTPTAILFFSSTKRDAYNVGHVKILREVANHLALLLMATQQPTVEELPPAKPEESLESGPQRLALSQLQPAMVLAEPLRTPDGRLLLGAGARISLDHLTRIRRLRTQGVLNADSTVVLATGETMDSVTDGLSSDAHQRVVAHTQHA